MDAHLHQQSSKGSKYLGSLYGRLQNKGLDHLDCFDRCLFWKLRVVTDPSTGTVYVPSGRDNGTNMAVYNPESSMPAAISMPPVEIMPTAMNAYSAVWSTQRNSILIYGGTKYFDFQKSVYIGNPYLVEFCPRTHTWSRVPTTGASPGDISCHSYNGTKMVVFGGVSVGRETVPGIYILDVAAMTWSRGKDVDPLLSRSDMVCSVAGDNFIAWGGEYDAQRMESLGKPVIYNLKSGQWTDEFIVPQAAASASTSHVDASSPYKVNVAAAVGGGIGGALVIAVLVAFLIYRRRKKSQQSAKERALVENDTDSHRTEEGKFNESAYLVPCDSSPRSLSQAAGFQQPPGSKMELHQSPSALAYHQQPPSEGMAYYPAPSPDTAYPVPPIIHGKGDIYHDGDSQIYHQSPGYISSNNETGTPPDSRELKRRTNDPQYKPQQGSARVNSPEDHIDNDDNEDQRIQRHINRIREQQEKQQRMQQDLERLRLEQREQLQLLESRLKAKE
ncbi:hypothetical protein BGZ70_005581 [Mortierella alpina]|uniref:Kelch repeat protein n=1 Tax=Mortierella alpina TaxID=64518 RepID=A0A9P6J8Y1_MORAP|nr:hypothetical protein BGZ70_005581 [Mortierella alpina]